MKNWEAISYIAVATAGSFLPFKIFVVIVGNHPLQRKYILKAQAAEGMLELSVLAWVFVYMSLFSIRFSDSYLCFNCSLNSLCILAEIEKNHSTHPVIKRKTDMAWGNHMVVMSIYSFLHFGVKDAICCLVGWVLFWQKIICLLSKKKLKC